MVHDGDGRITRANDRDHDHARGYVNGYARGHDCDDYGRDYLNANVNDRGLLTCCKANYLKIQKDKDVILLMVIRFAFNDRKRAV